MNISQGDVFWIAPNETNGIESDHTHPHVVVQVNAQNKVTVCALTTNLKRAKEPGNVLLDEGEANLPKQSVIVASQVSTVDETQLGEFIGSLSEKRIQEVLAGVRFLKIMAQHHENKKRSKMKDDEQLAEKINNLLNHICTLAMMWRSQTENRTSIQIEYLDTYNKLRALGWNDAIDWDCELPQENMPKEYVAAFPLMPFSWHATKVIKKISEERSRKKTILQKLKDWLK